jgi:hypothetical protein
MIKTAAAVTSKNKTKYIIFSRFISVNQHCKEIIKHSFNIVKQSFKYLSKIIKYYLRAVAGSVRVI